MSSPADLQPDVGVVVVAAGAGVRAGPGEPKQFRPILGVPMLLRALRPFTGHPAVRQVIVALPPGYAERPPEWLGKLRGDRLRLVPGGAQRADSVRAGLDALPADSAIILVHDAARRADRGSGAHLAGADAARIPAADVARRLRPAARNRQRWRTER